MKCMKCNYIRVSYPYICTECEPKEVQEGLKEYYKDCGFDSTVMRCVQCYIIIDIREHSTKKCPFCGKSDPLGCTGDEKSNKETSEK